MGREVGRSIGDHPPAPLLSRSTAGLTAPLLLLTIFGAAGNLLAPTMLERAPFLLAMLNPRTPFLLAAAPSTPPLPFLLLALARLVAADPSHYLLGRRHGPAALAWVGSRGPHADRLLQFVSRQFSRAGVLLVFLAPKGKVLLVAGAHNAPLRAVAFADCAGTLLRLSGLYLAGHAMPELVAATAPIVSHTVFVGSVAGAVISLVSYRSQRGREGARARRARADVPRDADDRRRSLTRHRRA